MIVTGRAFSYLCKFVFDKLDWWLEVLDVYIFLNEFLLVHLCCVGECW